MRLKRARRQVVACIFHQQTLVVGVKVTPGDGDMHSDALESTIYCSPGMTALSLESYNKGCLKGNFNVGSQPRPNSMS